MYIYNILITGNICIVLETGGSRSHSSVGSGGVSDLKFSSSEGSGKETQKVCKATVHLCRVSVCHVG